MSYAHEIGRAISSSEVFQYGPLDSDAPSIRLIKVLPTLSSEGFVQCTLEHADVNAVYICLSYMWGHWDHHDPILINGKFHLVRRNLSEFLKVAQKVGRDRYGTGTRLWIDALCIDQQSIAERNEQVQKMGEIFTNAAVVIVWLGHNQLLENFVACLSPSVQRSPADASIYLRAFSQLEHWRRAWITQEIFLAKELILWVGLAHIRPQTLLEYFVNRVSTQELEHVKVFHRQRLFSKQLPKPSLIQLLAKYDQDTCWQPRDRIYSLLAVCGEGSDLHVDYAHTTQDSEIFYQTMQNCAMSFCFCSMVVVASTLKLCSPIGSSSKFRVTNLYPDRKFAEITVRKPQKPSRGSALELHSPPPLCEGCGDILPFAGVSKEHTALFYCPKEVCPSMENEHLVVEMAVVENIPEVRYCRFGGLPVPAQKRLKPSEAGPDHYTVCINFESLFERALAYCESFHASHLWNHNGTPKQRNNRIRPCDHNSEEEWDCPFE